MQFSTTQASTFRPYYRCRECSTLHLLYHILPCPNCNSQLVQRVELWAEMRPTCTNRIVDWFLQWVPIGRYYERNDGFICKDPEFIWEERR